MKSLLALLKGTGVKPTSFSPHDFEVADDIKNREGYPAFINNLGLTHDPRVKTTDPGATQQEQHQAIIDLRNEVKEKFYA